MKIGILTFWKTEDNYGQLLQCYATQTYLKSLGHEPFLVKATNGHEYNPTFKEQLIDKLRTVYRLLPYPGYLIKRASKSLIYTLTHGKLKRNITERRFEKFRQQYLNCTREYTLEELRKNPPEADAYVVGSDQIWNSTDGMYFLSWADDSAKKISIAASFGSRSSSDEFCALIAPWLKRFDFVTVRENSGLKICSDAGRKDAKLVPDPTLLLRADDYLKIASDKYPREPYLFIYFLGTRTDINWKEIFRFAKEKDLKVVYVGSQGQEDKFPKEEPTIPEWLALIAHAEYVITNSFHGTIFAMQFQRKFMVFPVCGASIGMNNRLTTLLKPLGLESHIYNESISLISEPINYSNVFTLLNAETQNAKGIFDSIL